MKRVCNHLCAVMLSAAIVIRLAQLAELPKVISASTSHVTLVFSLSASQTSSLRGLGSTPSRFVLESQDKLKSQHLNLFEKMSVHPSRNTTMMLMAMPSTLTTQKRVDQLILGAGEAAPTFVYVHVNGGYVTRQVMRRWHKCLSCFMQHAHIRAHAKHRYHAYSTS